MMRQSPYFHPYCLQVGNSWSFANNFLVTEKRLFSASQFLASSNSLGCMKSAEEQAGRGRSGIRPATAVLVKDIVADLGQRKQARKQQAAEQQNVAFAHPRSSYWSGLSTTTGLPIGGPGSSRWGLDRSIPPHERVAKVLRQLSVYFAISRTTLHARLHDLDLVDEFIQPLGDSLGLLNHCSCEISPLFGIHSLRVTWQARLWRHPVSEGQKGAGNKARAKAPCLAFKFCAREVSFKPHKHLGQVSALSKTGFQSCYQLAVKALAACHRRFLNFRVQIPREPQRGFHVVVLRGARRHARDLIPTVESVIDPTIKAWHHRINAFIVKA